MASIAVKNTPAVLELSAASRIALPADQNPGCIMEFLLESTSSGMPPVLKIEAKSNEVRRVNLSGTILREPQTDQEDPTKHNETKPLTYRCGISCIRQSELC